MKRTAAAFALALASASTQAQQCIATPPIIVPSGPLCSFYSGGALGGCFDTPAQACDAWCGGKQEEEIKPYTHLYYCHLKGDQCGKWEVEHNEHASGFANLQTVRLCAPGYKLSNTRRGWFPFIAPGQESNALDSCISILSIEEEQASKARGQALWRDISGNVLEVRIRIESFDGGGMERGKLLAAFGDYDSYGRPGWSDNGAERVSLTWPADGGCSVSASDLNGWVSRYTWSGAERASSITASLYGHPATYRPTYFEDGHVRELDLSVALFGSLQVYRYELDDAGRLLALHRLALPPVVAAAPGSSATAAATAPPLGALEPRLKVIRPALGGPAGASLELLGPLGMVLYPPADLLGRQIARFFMNASAVNDEALNDRCAVQLSADDAACRKFWLDRKLDPDNLPTEATRKWHHDCVRSSRERHSACVQGKPLLPLLLPFEPAVGLNLDCERQFAADRLVCIDASVKKFPGGSQGPTPTLYFVALSGCMESARRRFEQCRAGALLTPLTLP